MKRLSLAVLVLLLVSFASEAQACWRVRCCKTRVRTRVCRVVKAPVRVVHRAIEVIPTPPPMTCPGGACKIK